MLAFCVRMYSQGNKKKEKGNEVEMEGGETGHAFATNAACCSVSWLASLNNTYSRGKESNLSFHLPSSIKMFSIEHYIPCVTQTHQASPGTARTAVEVGCPAPVRTPKSGPIAPLLGVWPSDCSQLTPLWKLPANRENHLSQGHTPCHGQPTSVTSW